MLGKSELHKIKNADSLRVSGVSEAGYSLFLEEIARRKENITVFVGKNLEHITSLAEELAWLNPDLNVHIFPVWDVQPYDRLSADGHIQAQRVRALSALKKGDPCIILTTVNALSIKVPDLEHLPEVRHVVSGSTLDREELIAHLVHCGYMNVGTVMEAGEFSVRGSFLDIFIPTEENPVRLDFFDDELESIKAFDPSTQRTLEDVQSIEVRAVGEMILNEQVINTFRKNYREQFPNGLDDPLYKEISAGRLHDMMGHYLPLFFETALKCLLELLPQGSTVITHPMADEAMKARTEEINEAYDSRLNFLHEAKKGSDDIYRPIKREFLYLSDRYWSDIKAVHQFISIEDFDVLDGEEQDDIHVDLPAQNLLLAGGDHVGNTRFDRALSLVKKAREQGLSVLLTAFTPSALTRIEGALKDKGFDHLPYAKTFTSFKKSKALQLGVAPLSWGVENREDGFMILTEQDIFGEKNNRPVRKKKRKAEEVISHFSELEVGSLIVHDNHGIGRFEGLLTMDISGETQDFVHLTYDGGDRLYVPVVSMDLLSKYGGDAEETKLDKLGGVAWQARKAKVKEDLMAMAGDLISVAAKRKTRKGHRYSQPDGLYDEFCAGFPYVPTSEQLAAVEDVENDMYSDRAMDRLVVGDVGFGKTEVAMRSAFLAAADGKQVALIVPTTLLARQHFENFAKRFEGFPMTVKLLSRFVTGKQKKETLDGMANGAVDIVIGTHALLSESVKFKDLGLMIVDEEQRFGVGHKEKLKAMKSNVDVLTLTATPIPRTLQMSLSGLRSLSMITTPPVDRLAVRSYVMKFDKKTIREAILREIFRGGQVFVVTPRVDGLEKLADQLSELVPEAKIRTAHGQMPKDALDRTMTDFYDNKFNVLVATTIIESGIDVPRANTLIVHKADRFGLAQLYQIRGRVGRSKVRAYAYFLLPQNHMSDDAVKRLKILQRLEGIGAGFTLASYDMDIRGAGNILGKQQSGQVKEVGFELYNKMLHEAVAEVKARKSGEVHEHGEAFSPTLNLGLTFLIPENYVPDLTTRMALYRRLSAVTTTEELEDMRDELLDRFGSERGGRGLPAEVEALLHVVHIKNQCRKLNIEKVDVGPKGVVISLFNKTFPNPTNLMMYIQNNVGVVSLKPDQRIVIHRAVGEGIGRLSKLEDILKELEELL